MLVLPDTQCHFTFVAFFRCLEICNGDALNHCVLFKSSYKKHPAYSNSYFPIALRTSLLESQYCMEVASADNKALLSPVNRPQDPFPQCQLKPSSKASLFQVHFNLKFILGVF